MPRLDKSLHVRLSDEELSSVKDNARLLGVSVSEYFRMLAALRVELVNFRAGDPVHVEGALTLVRVDRRDLVELGKQIRAWGNHYNQAVSALDAIKSRHFAKDEDVRELMSKMAASLSAIEDTRLEMAADVRGISLKGPVTINGKVW